MTKRVKSVSDREPHYIRAWRKHRRLTQARLAEMLETTGATVSRVENGKIGYTQEFLEACASALNCSTADLLRGPPDERSEIMQTINKMTVQQRKQAIKMLRIISEQELSDATPAHPSKSNSATLKLSA